MASGDSGDSPSKAATAAMGRGCKGCWPAVYCPRVSKKWYQCCKLIKKRRKAPAWLSFISEKEKNEGYSADDQILENIKCLSSEPKHAIMFCNFEMTEFRCRAKSRHNNDAGVSSDARPVRKTRVQLISVEAYMKQVLPTECAIHGTVTDGVIATHWDNITEELEDSGGVITCLMFPEIPGTEIYGFYEGDATHRRDDIHPPVDFMAGEGASNGGASSEEMRRATLFSRNGTVNTQCLQEVTGIPSDRRIRLLLLFEWGYHMSGWSKDLSRAVLQHYGNVVIAGGIVDSFFNERESFEHSVHGIAFCGSEEDLQVASIVVPSVIQDPKEIETKLKLLKDTHISEQKSVGFMFSCVGRGSQLYDGQENVESGIFRKLFPATPLFGGFMNGELGMTYLPDYTAGCSKSVENRGHQEGESLCHTYSSVFVILSFRN